jgi:hypothetical protein
LSKLESNSTKWSILKFADAEKLTMSSFAVNVVWDVVLPDPNVELFCAEILRMPLLSDWGSSRRPSTHGILLQWVQGREPEDRLPPQYDRVGKFLFKPAYDEPADRFSRGSLETIRII